MRKEAIFLLATSLYTHTARSSFSSSHLFFCLRIRNLKQEEEVFFFQTKHTFIDQHTNIMKRQHSKKADQTGGYIISRCNESNLFYDYDSRCCFSGLDVVDSMGLQMVQLCPPGLVG